MARRKNGCANFRDLARGALLASRLWTRRRSALWARYLSERRVVRKHISQWRIANRYPPWRNHAGPCSSPRFQKLRQGVCRRSGICRLRLEVECRQVSRVETAAPRDCHLQGEKLRKILEDAQAFSSEQLRTSLICFDCCANKKSWGPSDYHYLFICLKFWLFWKIFVCLHS